MPAALGATTTADRGQRARSSQGRQERQSFADDGDQRRLIGRFALPVNDEQMKATLKQGRGPGRFCEPAIDARRLSDLRHA